MEKSTLPSRTPSAVLRQIGHFIPFDRTAARGVRVGSRNANSRNLPSSSRADIFPTLEQDLFADLTRAGFVDRGSKGSHRNFIHEATGARVTVSGNAGDDAHHYQEKQVKLAPSTSKRKRK